MGRVRRRRSVDGGACLYVYIIAASFEFYSTVLSKHRNTLLTKVLSGRCNAFPLRYIYSRAHDILGKTVSQSFNWNDTLARRETENSSRSTIERDSRWFMILRHVS